MDTGTAETLDEIEEMKRRSSGLLGSSGSGSSGGSNGGGGGSDNANDDASETVDRFNSQKSRIFTFFLLLAILMTFGGLIAAYIVIATNNAAEWRPFDLPIQVWISTAIILASSVSYHLAQTAIEPPNHPAAKKWLVVTTVLGATFISSQILAWIALVNRGLYMTGNPYAGFFYILTAVHVVHVLGGIAALGSVVLRTWHPATDATSVARTISLANVVGWYWHFMGGLWLVLFVLLGFWK